MSKGDDINYTEHFLFNDVYDTVEEGCEATKRIAQTFNFKLTKGSNKINKAEREYRVYLYCSRGRYLKVGMRPKRKPYHIMGIHVVEEASIVVQPLS